MTSQEKQVIIEDKLTAAVQFAWPVYAQPTALTEDQARTVALALLDTLKIMRVELSDRSLK